MEKIKPIQYKENLCFKCLQEKDNIITYHLHERGYGSIFDGTSTKLQLCKDCNDEHLHDYFYENPTYDKYSEEYKYEEKINEFIKTLPIQGRELYENYCTSGWTSYKLNSQDWLDIELDIAPDEVYKRNNMYSPSEIKAYEERFPTCKHTYNKEYSDKSVGCYCPYGASGHKDAVCGSNISSKCYYCKNYEQKYNNNIKTIKESILNPSDIKIITMKEWKCIKCGTINHTYSYDDNLVCDKCYEIHHIKE